MVNSLSAAWMVGISGLLNMLQWSCYKLRKDFVPRAIKSKQQCCTCQMNWIYMVRQIAKLTSVWSRTILKMSFLIIELTS
jgi:hypothetical protein